MQGSHTVGLVLAAGMSSRMGAFKPLLPFCSDTVIGCAVGGLLAAGCESVTVVVGYRGDEVADALSERFGERVRFAVNPDYADTDMLRSAVLGMQEMPRCERFFLLPGDMPMVRQDTYAMLLKAHRGGITIPLYRGRRGHPALLETTLTGDILAYNGGDGLRGFFRSRSDVLTVETEDGGVLADLDTKEDYDRHLGGCL